MNYKTPSTYPEVINTIGDLEFENRTWQEPYYNPSWGAPLKLDPNGPPTAIEMYGKTVEIEIRTSLTDTNHFFAHTIQRHADGSMTDITFENNEAAIMIYRAVNQLTFRTFNSIIEAHSTQEQLESVEKPGTYKQHESEHNSRNLGTYEKLETLDDDEKDIFTGISEDLLKWVEEIQKKNQKVELRSLKLDMGDNRLLKVKHIILGNVSYPADKTYETDRYIVQTLLFCDQVLKCTQKNEILIIENALLDAQDSTGKGNTQYEHFTNTSAGAVPSDNYIFINHQASQHLVTSSYEAPSNTVATNTKNVISFRHSGDAIPHEIAHLVDPSSAVTQPIREGFATAVEMEFSFKQAKRTLIRASGIDLEQVSPERFAETLSMTPPENLSASETYYLTGTFFCHVYQTLGPINFMNFYNALTGVGPNQESKGNIYLALESLNINSFFPGDSAKTYVKFFLNKIKSRW